MPSELINPSEEDQFTTHVQEAFGILARYIFRSVSNEPEVIEGVPVVSGSPALSAAQTCKQLGISRTTLYRRLKTDKDFPQPHDIAGISRWLQSEIDEYKQRPQARRR